MCRLKSYWLTFFSGLTVILCVLCPVLIKAQTGLYLPEPEKTFPPLTAKQLNYPLAYSLSERTPLYPKMFTWEVTIDSSGQFVIIRYKYDDTDLLIPQYLTLEQYIQQRLNRETDYALRSYFSEHYLPAKERDERGGITLKSPKIRSKTFKRLFGGDELSLNVTGNITIDGTYRHEKRQEVMTATNRAPTGSFNMKQTQRFKVEGKIGENVSVFVDQDSERPFEFQNALQVQYRGDEDAILQSIDAGNVSLSLPGTQFVTFSAQNSGLFGVKARLKLGNLNVTTIASMEKGQKKKLTLTGGKEEGATQIQDYNYVKNTYFFLHERYRAMYPQVDEEGLHEYNPEDVIIRIEVYKSGTNYQSDEDAFHAWAVVDPDNPDTSKITNDSYEGYFLRLEPNEDYYMDKKLGYIRMNRSLQDYEVLAVSFQDTSGNVFGTLPDEEGVFPGKKIFKIIKPRSPTPDLKTWDLEWKNVYNLGNTQNINQEDFDLKIYYKTPSGDPLDSTKPKGESRSKSYLEIFGLDRKNESGALTPDGNIDFGNSNIIDLERGELFFPDLTPFTPDTLSDSKLPEDQWAKFYYIDPTNQSEIIRQSNFYIEVKSSSLSRLKSTYQLGINVIEGSEKVTLNGALLERGTDYNIDYRSGMLTITREGATDPNANLDVTYELQEMFSIDKKMLLGARAEYNLWEKEDSRAFIGGTLLYRSLQTVDRRVNIGKETPFSNFVWDINTSVNVKNQFLTKAFNYLPLLKVAGDSKVSFEGEIAQVIPNPNSLNNASTGDKNGVAYLDDFEGAKLENKININGISWSHCSQPVIGENNLKASLNMRGYTEWINPYNKVDIHDIWPNKEISTQMGGSARYKDVLEVRFHPVDTLDTAENRRQCWGGLQKALPTGYANQIKSRFLEVWIKLMEGYSAGKVHIDIGCISEDVISNGRLDTEDQLRSGLRDGVLQPNDEDTGIDGVWGDDPPYLFYPHEPAVIEDGRATPYDFWDLDGNGVKSPDEPWSYDDYEYNTGDEYSKDIIKFNGTENSINKSSVKIPDSEDSDGNSTVDLTNDYFSFSFSLDENSPDTSLIDGYGKEGKGWRKYQLRLNEPDTVVGNPQWSRIKYIRVWVDSVDSYTRMQIAEISLVGNEWRFKGIYELPDTTNFGVADDTTMVIKVYNTDENKDEYSSPEGVSGEYDPVRRVHSREQALVLKLHDLPPNRSAVAQKTLYQPVDLIHYKVLKMFLHGGDIVYTSFPPDSSPVEFYFQIGSDTKNENYYEIRYPVYQGWDEKNTIELPLKVFSELKLNQQADEDTSSIVLDNGHIVTIVGSPTVTNVRWLRAGIINKTNRYFSGEVWLNELRLSNVRKEKGMAIRAKSNVQIGDFCSINGSFDKRDADFHTVNERFGGGSNAQSYAVNVNVNMDKFLPVSWGLNIPVRANYGKSLSTPKYMPGSDIIVDKDIMTDEQLEEVQTVNESQGLSVSFSKTQRSRHFFGRYLFDPIKAQMSYRRSDDRSSRIRFAKSLSYNGSFSYSLNINKKYSIKPFIWLGDEGFLGKIADFKIYYPFNSFSFKINANDSKKESENREGVPKSSRTATLNNNVSIRLQPVDDLSVDYSSSQSFNMVETPWEEILSSLPERLDYQQRFQTNFTPTLFSWFSPSFKYDANYRWQNNIQRTTASKSAGVNAGLTISGKFSPDKFISMFEKGTKEKTIRRPQTRRRRQTQTEAEEKEEETKDTEKQEEKNDKPSPVTTILSTIGNTLKGIEPISVNFSTSKTRNDQGILVSPSNAYKFGFSDEDLEYSEKVSQPRTGKRSNRITMRSGINIANKVNISFDYNYDESKNISSQTTETISNSVLYVGDTEIPFPSWTVRWSGLEKISFISSVFQSININHGFSGKRTEQISNGKTTNISMSSGFNPLIGISLRFKNDITTNIQYSNTVSISEQTQYGSSKSKELSSKLIVSGQYTLKKGIKLPFIKKRFDNTIDMSLKFNMGNDIIYKKRGEGEDMAKSNFTKSWSLEPRISYTFSRSVQGGIHFEFGEREGMRVANRKITAFGIHSSIKIG